MPLQGARGARSGRDDGHGNRAGNGGDPGGSRPSIPGGADHDDRQRNDLRLLRHELGHAIQHAYNFQRRRAWQRTFGKASTPYPKAYRPNPASRRYVQNLPAWYAQSHPTEDFAETFAVWMQPKGLAAWARVSTTRSPSAQILFGIERKFDHPLQQLIR